MVTVSSKIDMVLFDELKEECLRYIKLLSQLELEDLTEDQKDEILGEMTASLTHLNVHSGLLKKEIEE